MAQYRVLTKSFVNNSIREEGEIVEYDGKPGSNLELIKGDPEPQKGNGKKGAAASSSNDDANVFGKI